MISFPTRRIGHANLFITELARSMDFYMNICGFEQTARESHAGAGFLSNGNTNHDIGAVVLRNDKISRHVLKERPGRGEAAGLNHFGWELACEADLVGGYKRAHEAGQVLQHIDMGTGRSAFIFDDDGVQHQFYASQTRDWRQVYTGGEVELHANPPWDPFAQPPSTDETFDLSTEIRRVEAPPLHPQRITHAVMVAPNLDASTRFYTDVAGLTVARQIGDGAGVYLAGSAARHDIVLLAPRDGLEPGLHHCAFEVWPDDDLDQAVRDLEALGVPVELTLDLPYKKSVFITDPDGIRFEFYQHRGDAQPSGVSGSELADAA